MKKRKFSIAILLLMTVCVAQAQKVTFYSPGFEEGVKVHIGLGENEDVLQTQTDTITRINLSGLEITDLRDAVYLPVVEELDLSYNSIVDVSPLLVLDSLRVLNLSHNQLESVNILAFVERDSMKIDVTNNYISDFSYFFSPTPCEFTFKGMSLQMVKDAPYLDICQLFADVDINGKLKVFYRGYTNMTGTAYVECGAEQMEAILDGNTNNVVMPSLPAATTVIKLTNGEKSDSTYVVPISFYSTSANEAITIETGLPEKYRIDNAGAKYGTVTIDGTKLHYTAPDENMPDVVAFSYYEGARFRGYSYFLAGLHLGDANGDGSVDIADAVCIVNHVVGKPNTTFIEAAADANGDGDIDIADAVHIVNYVVGKIQALAPRFEWNLPEPE